MFEPLLFVHVAISLVGIGTGFVVIVTGVSQQKLCGLICGSPLNQAHPVCAECMCWKVGSAFCAERNGLDSDLLHL